MANRTLMRLCVGVTLLLAGCSNDSTTSASSPPSSVPVVTPNPSNAAFGALCADLGRLEQVVSAIIGGTVSPSEGVQQVQDIGRSLSDDAQQLQQSQPQVAATVDDLSKAVDELRAALSQGGNSLDSISAIAAKIGADLQQIPTNVCGSSPSPVPS